MERGEKSLLDDLGAELCLGREKGEIKNCADAKMGLPKNKLSHVTLFWHRVLLCSMLLSCLATIPSKHDTLAALLLRV